MVSLMVEVRAYTLDRFGKTHWDFKTEEYGMGVDPDKIDTAWQACRGSEFVTVTSALYDPN